MGAALGLALAATLAALTGCAKGSRGDSLAINADRTRFTVEVSGITREGAIHIPPAYDGSEPYPLVFGLHGATGTGELFRAYGFDRLADELGFIVAYPDGIGRRWDAPTDNGFFEAMIAGFSKKLNVDTTRIYLTGHSAGAIKSYTLALAMPGRFAAIAPVAGLLYDGATAYEPQPVSVLHIHARDDETVPFAGAAAWRLLSAQASVDFWKELNGAVSGPEPLFDTPGAVGTIWRGEGHDTASLFYAAGGHSWPREATEAIMEFFYTHPARTAAVAVDAAAVPFAAAVGSPIRFGIASDRPERIAKVTYYANGEEIGSTETAPFTLSWKAAGNGIVRFSCEAAFTDGTNARSVRSPSTIVIRAPTQPEKLAIVSARSSSVQTGENAAMNAADGDRHTRWESAWNDDEYVELDLGSVRALAGALLEWEIAFAREYAIELSEDGAAWRQAALKTDGAGNAEYVPLEGESARFVRVRCLKRGTEWGNSLWEITVLGS